MNSSLVDDDSSKTLNSQFASRSAFRVVIETLVHFAIVVVGTLGNSLVIWIVFKNKNSAKLANLFIGALAVSDFLILVLTGWTFLSTLVLGTWPFSDFVCQYQGFTGFGLACASLFLITQTSINRYFKVVCTKHYRSIYTPKRTKAIIIGTTLLSFLGPSQYLANGGRYIFHSGKYYCFQKFELTASTSWYLYGIFVPTAVITFCYYKIFRTIRLHQSRIKAMRQNAGSIIGPNVEDIKATRTLFLTVVGFLCCWTPVIVIDIVDFARIPSSHSRSSPTDVQQFSTLPRELYVLYTLLATLSSSINPFIYGAMNNQFRQEYRKVLCVGRATRSTEVEVIRTTTNPI
ncbi:melatonin receptor type 1C-like [Nematostella vectensis]|uniref:melatonin receptor type 1C-like n=1 Tax=Nematostella vectensis TaxID=45351 RepID=UPI0020775F66|nr:melatonin receptor type 1C-like [Nematostella vectensis]